MMKLLPPVWRSRMRKHCLRAGRAAFLMMLISLPSFAQQGDDAGNGLDARLERISSEIDALSIQLDAARGANRDPIRQSLWTQQRQYRQAVWDHVDAMDPAGVSAGDEVADLLSAVSASLRNQIEANDDRIAELQLAVESAEGEDAESSRDELRIAESHRMNLLQALVDNVNRLRRFELPAEDDATKATVLLRNRAQWLSGRIELEKLRRDGFNATMAESGADSEEHKQAKQQLAASDVVVSRSAEQLSEVADLLQALGEDVAEYRQTEFMATGNLSAEFFDARVVGSVLTRWFNDLKTGLLRHGPDMLTRLVVVVIILVLFWFLSRIVRSLMRRGLDNMAEEMSTLARNFLVGFSVKVVLIAGVLVALSQFGLKIGPLLAGLGIVGFIVGFALQDTLSNFASGIMILIYRPFDVGDYVNAAGVEGEVRRMNLVSTTVHTPQNHRLIIPNNKIWGDIIRNITSQAMRRVDLSVGVSYEDDVEKVERLLHAIVAGHPKVKQTPEPVVRLHNLGESSVDFTVRVWVDSGDFMAVFWELTREIKLKFDAEGISFPYPQRTVHLVSAEGGDERG